MRFFLFLLLFPGLAAAQKTALHPWPLAENRRGERLFFVPDAADTSRYTGSVETTTGKVILPKGFILLSGYEDVPEKELLGNFVLIVPQDFKEPVTDTAMHYSYGFATFNQKGQFLNHPFIFDNGPDYWREGRRRVVENGKMGLVNRMGKAVIPVAGYRFLEVAQNGIVFACRDCSFYNPHPEKDEHGGVFRGDDWDALDVDGKLLARHISPQERRNDSGSAWRQKRPSKRTSSLTRKLASQLLRLPQTAAHARLYSTPLRELRYVCYDVPSAQCPYYHFGLESKEESSFPADDMQVLISADGKTIFHLEEDLQRLVPLKEWKIQEGE